LQAFNTRCMPAPWRYFGHSRACARKLAQFVDMQREHAMGLAALALMAWGTYLIYDMNELKKTPAFQEKAAALERAESGDKPS